LITQLPGAGTNVQVPSPLQESMVHANPSLHAYAVPPHWPAPSHASLLVQALPSLHEVPLALGLHAVWLVAGVHCWHWLLGLPAPLA
jgi:hypothetical protein